MGLYMTAGKPGPESSAESLEGDKNYLGIRE